MGIDGKESNGPTWLQAQLAAVVAGAIQNTLLLQARPEGLGDISVNDIALVAAADMTEQFDILPKGELQQEWGVQITENGKTVIETHPGSGEPLTREMAFYENRRWKSYGYNTEGVMSRRVSEWKREDLS